MPFPMKVMPLDSRSAPAALETNLQLPAVALKQPLPYKSRLKRILERQFRQATPPVLVPAAPVPENNAPTPFAEAKEKDNEVASGGGGGAAVVISEPEPSSLCLSKMVRNFLEGNNDKPARCGRRRCSCFNGNGDDSSDDEFDSCGEYSAQIHVSEIVKGLVNCNSVLERNIMSEVCKVLERMRSKNDKEDGLRRRIVVVEALIALGYDASVCKSKWEQTATTPAGDYDYIDVLLEGAGGREADRRLLIDIDFRSEFQIARATKRYRAVLQSLPVVFVGKPARLQQIVAVASEAARQSLKKRGLHVPPWRKSQYMAAKWFSSYERTIADGVAPTNLIPGVKGNTEESDKDLKANGAGGGVGYVVVGGPKHLPVTITTDGDNPLTKPPPADLVTDGQAVVEKPGGIALALGLPVAIEPPASEWQPPAVTPKAPTPRGLKVVTGLASIILDAVDG